MLVDALLEERARDDRAALQVGLLLHNGLMTKEIKDKMLCKVRS